MRIKFLSAITSLLFLLVAVTSCLDSEDTVIENANDPTIYSFSISNIKTTLIEGKDTIKFTVKGSDYPFSIDQKQGIIFNRDSLPVNTNVSKVVIKITNAGGPVFFKKNNQDTLWYSTDSLNFSKAVSRETAIEFTSYSLDRTATRKYSIWINVHKQQPDSLVWNRLPETDFPGEIITGKQKAVLFNGQLFVFGEKETQVIMTSTLENNGHKWKNPIELRGISEKADFNSVTVFNNSLFISAGGKVYSSQNGADWTIASGGQPNIKNLIGAFTNAPTNTRLYAQDKRLIGISDDKFFRSANGIQWEETGSIPEGFPENSFAVTNAYPSRTNPDIERISLIGVTESVDTASVSWGLLSNESSFALLSPIKYNTNYCPRLENISLIYYNKRLYAFGGKSTDGKIKAFEAFYSSTDGGINWKKVTRYQAFPKEFSGRENDFSYIVDSYGFLWVIWSGSGEVWKGRINSLGFAK